MGYINGPKKARGTISAGHLGIDNIRQAILELERRLDFAQWARSRGFQTVEQIENHCKVSIEKLEKEAQALLDK